MWQASGRVSQNPGGLRQDIPVAAERGYPLPGDNSLMITKMGIYIFLYSMITSACGIYSWNGICCVELFAGLVLR